jgi:hypothetical protein
VTLGFDFNERGAANLGIRLARRACAQLDELVRFGIRQRPEQDGIDHAEDSGVGPDTERQREHRHRGEARILPQHPHAETNVLNERFAEARSPNIPALFPHTLHIPKSSPCSTRSLLRRHPRSDVLRRAHLEMQTQFVVNLLLHGARLSERAQPAGERYEDSHT